MSLSWSILLPAFLAGLLVLVSHVPLGREVLSRGIIFLDLAIAQIATLGVVLAYALGFENHYLVIQAFALLSAVVGALLLLYCEQRFAGIQEAIIGSSFVLAATASMLLLANDPHGSQHLADLLNGQILWVDYKGLLPLLLVTLLVLLILYGPWRGGGRIRFYIAFALAITNSVQLIGVYLVFASLILPAMAVYSVQSRALPMAYTVGIAGYLFGLVVSSLVDLPAGPVIVWSLAIIALCFMLFNKQKGRT